MYKYRPYPESQQTRAKASNRMYSQVIFVVAIVAVAGVNGATWFRAAPEFTVEIDEDHDGIIKLDLMSSLGLICSGDDNDNIAKVACGGTGTGDEVDDEGFAGSAEFSVLMTCKGDESKLADCDNKMQQIHKCDKFVAANCGGQRSLRQVL